nr:MAG TPA: hypothetical protein [Caudoviricetes sp.]
MRQSMARHPGEHKNEDGEDSRLPHFIRLGQLG